MIEIRAIATTPSLHNADDILSRAVVAKKGQREE
jgi:hypothetical protein